MNQKRRQENLPQTILLLDFPDGLFSVLHVSVPNFYTSFTAVPYAINSAAPCTIDAEEYRSPTMASAPRLFASFSIRSSAMRRASSIISL